ncbi:hypothetical protein [Caulobacter sp. RHG1]|uniref:hypothetical protein n=1 Tax=Caulobacter sp. (strain RHG1) TaxID=2545762 RepID=UPI001553CC3A|nr:hypothetical protein [Caulobacter sp. RHG1]NQE65327.1 hypothetical protein [Caulobacter sp. RHG1]
MLDLSTWLKTFAGALIACLLVIGLTAPSVRAGECLGDTYVAAQQFEAGDTPVFVASDLGADSDNHGAGKISGGEVCHKGHCHHAPAPAPPTGALIAEIPQGSVRLVPPASTIPPSRIPDGAKEPPRA